MNEAYMLELLRQRYTRVRRGTDADRYVRASHVRYPHDASNGLSFGQASRIADYVVMDTYGTGEIIGHEVKVSRADWLSELRDASKAETWKQHCHRWYLVVPDAQIVHPEELPDGWGLMAQTKTGPLRVRQNAPLVPDPNPLTTLQLASLSRSLAKTREREIRVLDPKREAYV